jgi:hypothetical protein
MAVRAGSLHHRLDFRIHLNVSLNRSPVVEAGIGLLGPHDLGDEKENGQYKERIFENA